MIEFFLNKEKHINNIIYLLAYAGPWLMFPFPLELAELFPPASLNFSISAKLD